MTPQEYVKDCLSKTSHVRLIYDPLTFELKQTIIPQHRDHLEHHQPRTHERHIDLPTAEYLERVHDDNNLPDPKKLMAHVKIKTSSGG